MLLDLTSNHDAIDRLPQALRGDNTRQWLGVYCDRLDVLQDTIALFLDGLLTWDQIGARTPAVVLAAIGRLLGQDRPSDATDDEFKRILTVRRVVRQSTGTAPNIRRVVNTLGAFGGGANVVFSVPHVVIVTFGNFASVAALGFTIDVVAQLLLDAIGDVDRLQIWDAVGNPFTWSIEGKGWLQAVWSTPLYDSED